MDPLSFLEQSWLDSLAQLAPRDPERARRLLTRVARAAGEPPEAVPLLESVLSAAEETADPELALLSLERWTSALPTPRTTLGLLRENPRLLEDLLRLFGASRYLSDVLARDPTWYALFTQDDSPRSDIQYRSYVEAAFASLHDLERRRGALGRIKRRALLRIGWRDLARSAPLEEVAKEISDLADALVDGAFRLAREELAARYGATASAVTFTVIALGKLGARELNYSSDIDLLFVMDSPDPTDEVHRRYAARLGERLIQVLSEDAGEGSCFRVDLRLRPEGRSGALVRSFGAFREYYDRWAESWERQALIKARPVAGDPGLGERFMRLIEPVVYRSDQGLSLLEDVREMRAARARSLAASGAWDGNVKEGAGTIREVEFTIQLLQLLFGADYPALRAPDTLTALRRLEEARALSPEERRVFEDGYRFFREVEHRLQLLDDLPVRLVPQEPAELRRLARSIHFTKGDELLAEYQRLSHAVSTLAETIHARLGAGAGPANEIRSAVLLLSTPAGMETLRAQLSRLEFPDLNAAVDALQVLALGPPGSRHPEVTRRLFADLTEPLLEAAANAADPTLAIVGLAQLAERKLLYRPFFQTLREYPGVLAAFCAFCGGAPAALRDLLRMPELSDLVADPEAHCLRKDRNQMDAELAERLSVAGEWESRLSALRRYCRREWIRIAARSVVKGWPSSEETEEWSDLADALLASSLSLAIERLRSAGRWSLPDSDDFAVFALGRLGGRELHFASDLDLFLVYESSPEAGQEEYERLGRALLDALQEVTPEGPLWEVDLRLRPEGRQGFLAAPLEGLRRYYGEGGRAQVWELQTLTRLRFVTGSAPLAEKVTALLAPRIYGSPMPAEWMEEIRHMKQRIERERVPAAEKDRNLKLGPGGLSDIEFLVQYLQLRHGGDHVAVRVPSTRAAIESLADEGLLADEERKVLLEALDFLTRARQSLTLLEAPGGADLLPFAKGEERLAQALARALHYESIDALCLAHQNHTTAVRALFLRWLG